MSEHILPFLWMKGESQKTILNELEKIHACGIDAVCIESRPHPDFLGEGWWKDMDFIMAEARKRKMKIWLLDDAHFPTGYANGLITKKYPDKRKKYLYYNMLDVWGDRGEVTINIRQMCRPRPSWRNRPSDAEMEERKKNRLKAVTAFMLREDNRVDETVRYDLTDQVSDGMLTVHFPAGSWRIFVMYETRTDGGNPEYIDMLDSTSVSVLLEAVYEPHYRRYGNEFGKTFAGFFSDEPGFGNTAGFAKDERIGVKQMPLPWSDQVEAQLENIYGDQWRMMLPYLWNPSAQYCEVPAARLNYMEIITDLYRENFSRQVGDWCRKHGVQYIGHVIEDNNQHSHLGCGPGHYFKAMAGQDMAGIDTIGCQIVPGGNQLYRSNSSVADGEFYQYALGKLGESAALLDPAKKNRCMCELFGAYGWSLRTCDMKWIVDTLLVRGVNYFVPHAFSMHSYPDPDCPPHFYAGGNNPLYSSFSALMKYAGKICDVLDGGAFQMQAAVLYHGEQEWIGDFMPMQKPARVLAQKQIEYLFVTAEMLSRAECSGKEFRINDIRFSCLVIPGSWGLPEELGKFLNTYKGPVLFAGRYPEKIIGHRGTTTFQPMANMICCGLEQLGNLCAASVSCDLIPDHEMKELVYLHKVREGKHIYMLHNESVQDTFRGRVFIRGLTRPAYYYAERDIWKRVPCEKAKDGIYIEIELPPYGALIIADCDPLPHEVGVSADYDSSGHASSSDIAGDVTETFMDWRGIGSAEKISVDLSHNWKVGKCRSIEYPHFENEGEWEKLCPMSRKYPEFSGVIRYEKTFCLKTKPDHAVLSLGEVHDAADVWINGVHIGACLAPPYRYPVNSILRHGENTIRIEISTTLQREQAAQHPEAVLPAFEALDPTGLYGRILLEYKKAE